MLNMAGKVMKKNVPNCNTQSSVATQQLAVLQKLCHDLMARASGAPTRFFPAEQLPPAPRWGALAQWSRELMTTARTVEHPYNAGLMQEAWAARTRQVLSGNAAAPRRP